MARKRRPVKDPPPSSSSDEEEAEEEKIPLKKQKVGARKDGSVSHKSTVPKPKHIANESRSKRKKPSTSSSNGGASVVKAPVTAKRWSEEDEIANSEKGQNGNHPVLSNPHDRELSSKDEDETEEKEESTQISSGSEEECGDVGFWKHYPCMKEFIEIEIGGRWRLIGCFMMDFLERKAEFIGGEKLKEMERKSKQLRIDELKLFVRRLELVLEIVKAELDAISETGI